MRKSRGMALAMAIACLFGPAAASAGPLPPCATAAGTPEPTYGALGETPNVGVWSGLVLGFAGDCPEILNGPAGSVVAISGEFRHDGTLEDLAERAGSVSAIEGVRYWSVSAGDWRPLVTLSRALEDPGSEQTRPDFSATEVLGGRTLYLAQRDGRSHGLNVYSMTAHTRGREQLTLTTVNETGIRFLVATLFEPRSLVSVVTVTRLGGDRWGYYGLLVAKNGAGRGREASLVNRAAAFQRYLTGQPSDGAPPLAP
jgi:hypothetical protein